MRKYQRVGKWQDSNFQLVSLFSKNIAFLLDIVLA